MSTRGGGGVWTEYARLRNRAMISVPVFFFGSLLVAEISIKRFGSTVPGFVFALGAAVFWFYLSWQVLTWPCPRCGKLYGCPYMRKCWHCKLPKWEEPGNVGRDTGSGSAPE